MNTNSSTEVQPVITLVTGPSGPVYNGGSTSDTALKVSGAAAPGADLDIWDGSMSIGLVRSTSLGNWEIDLTALTPTAHSITAMNVGGLLVSIPWVFTVGHGNTEGFESLPAQTLKAGESVETSTMIIRYISGGSDLYIAVLNLPGMSGNVMGVNQNLSSLGEVVRLELKRVVSSLSFKYFKYGDENRSLVISVLNSSGSKLAERSIDQPRYGVVEFSGYRDLKFVEVRTNQAAYFDDFVYFW